MPCLKFSAEKSQIFKSCLTKLKKSWADKFKGEFCKGKVSTISNKKKLTAVTLFCGFVLMNCSKFATLWMILKCNFDHDFDQIISK